MIYDLFIVANCFSSLLAYTSPWVRSVLKDGDDKFAGVAGTIDIWGLQNAYDGTDHEKYWGAILAFVLLSFVFNLASLAGQIHFSGSSNPEDKKMKSTIMGIVHALIMIFWLIIITLYLVSTTSMDGFESSEITVGGLTLKVVHETMFIGFACSVITGILSTVHTFYIVLLKCGLVNL
jgi:heme/copper-type cytochrome/quinol oxidase subunit 2